MYDGAELLVDLRNDNVGLSGEVRRSFTIFFKNVKQRFREFDVLLVQQITIKIHTSEMLSV